MENFIFRMVRTLVFENKCMPIKSAVKIPFYTIEGTKNAEYSYLPQKL